VKLCQQCSPENAARLLENFQARQRDQHSAPPQTPAKSNPTRSFASPTFSSQASARPPVRPNPPSRANRASTLSSTSPTNDDWITNRVELISERPLNSSSYSPSAHPDFRVNQTSSITTSTNSHSNSDSKLRSIRVEIDGTFFEFSAALDDGADITLMGSDHWRVLQHTSIPPTSVDMRFTLADGSTALAKKSIILDLHLQTSAGTVIARRQNVFIADIPLPDVLLGRPLLRSLGIDVERQLCDFASRNAVSSPAPDFDDRDIEHIPFGAVDKFEVEAALKQSIF
jgi:hypothetical protein